MTIWTPDCCGVTPACQIELNAAGEPTRHIFRCSAHTAKAMRHDAVAAECRVKEGARAEIASRLARISDDVSWVINPTDRVVELSVGGITAGQRTTITNALASRFGTKVRLV